MILTSKYKGSDKKDHHGLIEQHFFVTLSDDQMFLSVLIYNKIKAPTYLEFPHVQSMQDPLICC